MARDRTPEEVAARKAKKEAKKVAKRLAAEQAQSKSRAKAQAAVSTVAVAEEVGQPPRKTRRRAREGDEDEALTASLRDRLNPNHSCFDSDLKVAWATMTRAQKQALVAEDRQRKGKEALRDVAPELPKVLPFEANPDDHCETPPAAFHDIAPILKLLARRIGLNKKSLRLYDPYYCSGASKRHLAKLGFSSVYNQCEDFYEVLQAGGLPEHDAVVTNPPYSENAAGGENHILRLLRFLRKNKTPYLVNMPDYVLSAAYYRQWFESERPRRKAPLVFCPAKRYHFWTPEGAREEKNPRAHRNRELGIRTSPFVALWYVSLRPVVSHEELLSLAQAGKLHGIRSATAGEGHLHTPEDVLRGWLCRSAEELPAGRRSFKTLKAV